MKKLAAAFVMVGMAVSAQAQSARVVLTPKDRAQALQMRAQLVQSAIEEVESKCGKIARGTDNHLQVSVRLERENDLVIIRRLDAGLENGGRASVRDGKEVLCK